MKTKSFNTCFSFLLGLGLMALLRPSCKGDECIVLKAPPAHEVKDATYQIGKKCYKFNTYVVDCPSKGVIESFEVARRG